MLPGLFHASAVFTTLVRVPSARAAHAGDARLCSWRGKRRRERRGEPKKPASTEPLQINVTARPEDTVFTGQLSESGGSPSRKVSGRGQAVRGEASQTTAHLSGASRVVGVFFWLISAAAKMAATLN